MYLNLNYPLAAELRLIHRVPQSHGSRSTKLNAGGWAAGGLWRAALIKGLVN